MSPYSSLILRLDTTIVKKSQSVVLAYEQKCFQSTHSRTTFDFTNFLQSKILADEFLFGFRVLRSCRVGFISTILTLLNFLAGAAFCLGDTPAFALGFTAFAFGLTGGFALPASAANNRCLWGFIGIVDVEKTLFVTFSGSKWEQVGTVLGTSTT